MQGLASLTSNSWKLRAACQLNTCLSKEGCKCLLSFSCPSSVLVVCPHLKTVPVLLSLLNAQTPNVRELVEVWTGEESLTYFYLLPTRSQQGEMSWNWHLHSGRFSVCFAIYPHGTIDCCRLEDASVCHWVCPRAEWRADFSWVFFLLGQSEESKFMHL